MNVNSRKCNYQIDISGEELNKIYFICNTYMCEYYNSSNHSTYKDAKEILDKIAKLIWR